VPAPHKTGIKKQYRNTHTSCTIDLLFSSTWARGVSCSSLFSLLFSLLFSWEGPSPLSSILREGPSLFSSLGEVPVLSLLFSTKGGPSPLSSLLSSLLREGPSLFSSLGKAPHLSLLFSTHGGPS
jgi:hypothetical protein